MKRFLVFGVAFLLVVGAALMAGQGGKGGGLDLSTVRTVTGSVTDVAIANGQQHPSFLLAESGGDTLSVELGPYWYLVASGFAVAVGDQVSAVVANCAKCSSTEVLALSVQNLTNGTSITLRDDQGHPLWKGKRGESAAGKAAGGSRGNGGYPAASELNLSTLQSVEGELTAAKMGLGVHRNRVTLQAQGSGSYVVSLGPFWYMQQQGFSLEAGEVVRVRMALGTDGWAAFSVEKAGSGQTLQLRNDQGVPLWGM